MGLRVAGDPHWGYRLSPEALRDALAIDRLDTPNPAPPPRKKRGATPLVDHPQIRFESPAAAAFWTTP